MQKGGTFVASSLISARVVASTAWLIVALLVVNPTAYAQTDAVVPRNHPALAEGTTPSGGLEPNRPLSMSVTLALRNRDQLEQLLADQQNPASPEYHHFLTPDEFAARFGPDDFDAVRDWLVSEGFKVIATDTARRVIQFTGTVAQAEHTFEVAIQAFAGASFGNATDPHIPARFAGVISHIHGLDNMSARMPGLMPSQASLVAPIPEASLDPASAQTQVASMARDSEAGEPSQADPSVSVPGFSVGGDTFFGPSDFYTFYDEAPLLRSGLKGSSCIGIVGESKFLPNAIAFFNQKFKVSGSHITTVFADPGNPGFNNAELEAELDLEWSHTVAPGAASRFYLGNEANFQVDPISDAIAAAVSEDRCPVISISFGFCGYSNSFYTEVLDPLFAQAAAQGQSVITITHDYGAAYLSFDPARQQCVPGTSRAVSEVAADPNVTALSGTSFKPSYDHNGNDIGVVPERVWNDPEDGEATGGATGGGVSSIFTKPTFQSGPGVPADGMRDIPDLSLIASPYFPGSWAIVGASCFNPNTGCTGKGGLDYAFVGGTSLSAPAFAGVTNLIGQAVGGSLGNVDPTIYTLASKDLAGSGFRDVTVGNNDFNGVTGFSAGTDYDLCTGWGTVDVATFVAAYANTLPGPATVTLSPTSLTFGNVRAGTTSKPKFVTIEAAKGQTAWTLINSAAGSGVFAAAQTCVGQLISPGKSCKFGVTFHPVAPGPVGPLLLTVTDNAGNSPQTISLSGTAK